MIAALPGGDGWTITDDGQACTVGFNANGGTGTMAPQTSSVPAALKLNTFTRTGYTFAGWGTASDGPVVYADGATYDFTADMTLYAQWTANQYTITFNSAGGSAVASITQAYGSAVDAPATPTREGYTFAGWNPVVPATMPLNGAALTAQWTANDYTITFDSAGGSAVAPITQAYGSAVTAPADPTKTGYAFNGWNPAVPATMPLNGAALTAQWTANEYTITFDSAGGSAVAPITQAYGSAVTAPADPTKAGYAFNGWNPAFPATMPLDGAALTAQWTINQYTILFEENGGSAVADITQDYGTSVSAPAAPTKSGYAFGGWYSDVGLNTAYTFSTMPAENIALYAKWTINQYTISFDSNGGSAVDSITRDYGTIIAAPAAPILTGYNFAGWFTDDDTFLNAYSFSTMPADNVTLHAKWVIGQYTIFFNGNGGSTVSPITQDYGTPVTAPAGPTRTGHTFGGWYTDDGAFLNAYSFSTMPAENVSLYAKWTINQYTISFDSNGGSAVANITQDYDTPVSAPTAPTKTGHTFGGWFSDVGLNTAYTFSTMPAENIALYTKWTINQYTISFDSNGGSAVANITQDYDTPVSAPTAPTKTGHTFGGWFSDVGLNTAYIFSTMPAQNIALYAKWTANTYTVTFDGNDGGTPSPTSKVVIYDSAYGPLATVSRTGYAFNGWYTAATGGSLVTETTVVTTASDHSLHAQWTQLPFYNETDDTYYATLQAAVNAASAGDVIVAVTAGPFGPEGSAVVGTAGVTINLQGRTFGPGSPAFTISADDVTILGPGVLDGNGSTSPGILVNGGADNFILEGAEIREWAAGVEVAGAHESLKLVGNWMHLNTGDGIRFAADLGLSGIVTINGNLLKKNAGAGINNLSGVDIPATYNSWGDVGGPAGGRWGERPGHAYAVYLLRAVRGCDAGHGGDGTACERAEHVRRGGEGGCQGVVRRAVQADVRSQLPDAAGQRRCDAWRAGGGRGVQGQRHMHAERGGGHGERVLHALGAGCGCGRRVDGEHAHVQGGRAEPDGERVVADIP